VKTADYADTPLLRFAVYLFVVGTLCAVFQGCLEDGNQVFGCPSKHVIKVIEVKVGIIPMNDFDTGSGHCLLDEAVCSWQIRQAPIQSHCNDQSMCELTPEVYPQNVVCSQVRPEREVFVKFLYYCNKEEEGSVFQNIFLFLLKGYYNDVR